MDAIRDTAELERAVGTRPAPALMKSIDAVDEHCRALLARCPVAVLGYTDAAGRQRARVLGGAPGFVGVAGPTRLELAVPDDAAVGSGLSLLLLVPGWRESLRINGRLDGAAMVVGEAFVHCAKAILRSELWAGAPPRRGGPDAAGPDPIDGAAREFLAGSRFVVVTSADASGAADASPKGDPAGFVQVLGPTTVAVPDRPGNRRTDTLHNVVERPGVAVVAMVPGDDRTLELSGTARVTADPDLLAGMAVRDRAPKSALVLDVAHWWLRPSAALRAARFWDPAVRDLADGLPSASRIWTDHVRRNGTTGLAARAVRAVVNEPALRAGLSLDYRTLY